MSIKRATLIDLFCGCGGFSLGAELSGFHSLAAVDIDPVLQSSYRKNFPSTKVIEGDVSQLCKSHWYHMVGNVRPDGLIGGPPCQGFSRIGKRLKQDPRNSLVYHFYRHVKELRPKFFIMENVEGILDNCNKDILYDAIDLVSPHYNVIGPIVVNAASFGAATNRYRVVVIGYDPSDCNWVDPTNFFPEMQEKTTVKDAIGDLPCPVFWGEKDGSFCWTEYSKEKDYHISDYARMLRCAPPKGLGWTEAIRKHEQSYFSGMQATRHTDYVAQRYAELQGGKIDPISKSHKLRWDGLSPTLRAGTGADKGSFQAVRPIHPAQGRVITVREAARIQGFPDWFVFHPTKWHSFRMIGNSVSPLVSHHLLSRIRQIMADENNKECGYYRRAA